MTVGKLYSVFGIVLKNTSTLPVHYLIPQPSYLISFLAYPHPLTSFTSLPFHPSTSPSPTHTFTPTSTFTYILYPPSHTPYPSISLSIPFHPLPFYLPTLSLYLPSYPLPLSYPNPPSISYIF